MRTFAYDENPFTAKDFIIDEIWLYGKEDIHGNVKNYVLIGKKPTDIMTPQGDDPTPIVDDDVESVLIYTDASLNITPEIIDVNVNSRFGARNSIRAKKFFKVDEKCEGTLTFVFTPGMFQVCEYDEVRGQLIVSDDSPIEIQQFYEILRAHPDYVGLRLSMIVPGYEHTGQKEILYVDVNIPTDPKKNGEITVNRFDGSTKRYMAKIMFSETSARGNEYIPMEFSFTASPNVVDVWSIIEDNPYVDVLG